MKNNTIKRAVLYTRVSTDEQAEKGTSLSTQLAACLKQAEHLGAQVLQHHQDAGVSGARFESRPGIQAALRDIEEGRASLLIVYSISRMSRDREHQSVIQRRVRQAGGRILFCDMAVEDTPEGDLLTSITGDFAEYERNLFRRRSMTGRRRRAEDGEQPCRSPGMVPFGYVIPNKKDVLHGKYTLDQVGRYLIVEEEAAWVRAMFQRYAAGDSLRSLCRWLIESGVATPRNGQYWRPSTVKRILENPVYKGEATFGKRERLHDESLLKQGRSLPYLVRETSPEKWISIDAPALVDGATWQRCSDRLSGARSLFGGRPERKHLLTGLLCCPVCRRTMAGNRRERKRDDLISGFQLEHRYQCRDSRPSRNLGKRVCCATSYRADEAEGAVLNAIRHMARHPELTEAALLAYRVEEEMSKLREERTRLQKALTEQEARERATVQAQIRGIQAGADPSLYDAVFGEIAERRNTLTVRLAEIEAALGREMLPAQAKVSAELLAEAFADVEEALTAPELTTAERHDLIARVVTEVVPQEDGYRVEVRLPQGNNQTVATVSAL